MPMEYSQGGLRFLYPEGWELDESEMHTDKTSVSVYSPGGAFWSVSVHPRSAEPQDMADTAVQTMRSEYEQVDAESSRATVAGSELVGYEMSFFYLDLVCTATVHSLRTEMATYVFFCQGEDAEFQRQAEVFRAITTSFLDRLKHLSYWE